MIYIDIDGVIADTDSYIFSLDSRAKDDTHLLFKTIYRNYDKVFKYSEPLVDLSKVKALEEFTLLTALPSKVKIESFCETEQEVKKILNQLAENKRYWVKKHFGDDVKVIIVDKRADKIKYCKNVNDVLIDDSGNTCLMWKKAGGKAFTSIDDYVKKDIKNTVKVSLKEEELW